ncbi:hypothetical protein VNO77_18707 [Canavalia gladiata]|uniref:Uncharacterized protein n=1 Tax=Canavalia gladiata TaxID=3824 RepID=A0AAN9LRA1_CANGL
MPVLSGFPSRRGRSLASNQFSEFCAEVHAKQDRVQCFAELLVIAEHSCTFFFDSLFLHGKRKETRLVYATDILEKGDKEIHMPTLKARLFNANEELTLYEFSSDETGSEYRNPPRLQ